MAELFFMTLVSGASVFVDWEDVTYIEEDLTNAARCFVGTTTSADTARRHVAASAADTAADLHTASGITVGGFPFAPLVLVPKTGEGTDLYFQNATVSALQSTLPASASIYVDTVGAESPWLVTADLATLASDLGDAAGGGSGPSVASRLALQFFVNGADGSVLIERSDVDVSVEATTPYVGGSGNYFWTLTGADVPTNYNLVFSLVSGAPLSAIIEGRTTGSGLPTFQVLTRFPGLAIGSGLVASDGTATSNVHSDVEQTGTGVYVLTVEDFAPVHWTLGVTLRVAASNRFVEVEYLTPTTARVTFTNELSLEVDVDWSYSVIACANDGNGGIQPVEPVYSVQVWSMDA